MLTIIRWFVVFFYTSNKIYKLKRNKTCLNSTDLRILKRQHNFFTLYIIFRYRMANIDNGNIIQYVWKINKHLISVLSHSGWDIRQMTIFLWSVQVRQSKWIKATINSTKLNLCRMRIIIILLNFIIFWLWRVYNVFSKYVRQKRIHRLLVFVQIKNFIVDDFSNPLRHLLLVLKNIIIQYSIFLNRLKSTTYNNLMDVCLTLCKTNIIIIIFVLKVKKKESLENKKK